MSVILKAVICLSILASVNCMISRPLLEEIINDLSKGRWRMIPCKDNLLPQVNFKHHPHVKNEEAKKVFCKAHEALKHVRDCKGFNITKLHLNLWNAGGRTNCSIDKAEEFELNEFIKGLKSFTRSVFKESDWKKSGIHKRANE